VATAAPKDAPLTAARCSACSTEKQVKPTKRGEGRLPRGWKDICRRRLCEKCLHERYVLRGPGIPVSRPVGSGWKPFREALHAQWAICTAAVNYVTSRLYAADTPRLPGMKRLARMPQPYLYPEVRERFPDLQPTSANSLIQAATRLYAAQRRDVLWTGRAALRSARYPQPLPIHNQAWTVSLDGQHRPVVELKIGGQSWRLVLRTKGFRRQREMIKQIIAGQAEQCEAAIYRRGDDVMVKLVAWLPKKERPPQSGVLRLKTTAVSLLSGVFEDAERPWIMHGDLAKRWTAGHVKVRDRLGDDLKHEPRHQQTMLGDALRRESERVSGKYRRRMDTFCHEVAAQVASYAARCGAAAVEYDDSERWIEPFPYHDLETKIANKLNTVGIVFRKTGQSTEDDGCQKKRLAQVKKAQKSLSAMRQAVQRLDALP
jgi:hypothetical protein